MFKELAPLVRHRAILFTVSHVEDDQFRVNVIPKKIADGENDALTTPVSVTGTVEDLDKELPQTLLHFVSSHLELKNSLERAKAEMEEAAKVAHAEARKKSGNQPKRKNPAEATNNPPVLPEIPAQAKSGASQPVSLFDSVPEPRELAPCGTPLPETGSEIDEDEEILRGSCAGDSDEEA